VSRPAAVSRARDFWITRLPIVLLSWGAVLRVEQFAARRSLWLDEATLAINFVDRPFSQLSEPLGNGQGAPVGFLFVERAAVALLGNNEYALRLFPLACGVASLFVFLRIARRLLPSPAVPIAMGLFAFAPFLVYYSSEAKQYSVDVMVALIVTDLTLRLLDRERLTRRDALALGAAGAAAVWLSHSAIFVLAAAGLILLFERARLRRDILPLAAAGGAWLASLALAYAVSLRHLTGNETLLHYWRGAFVPRPLGAGRTIRWLAATGNGFFRAPGGVRLTVLAALLGALGAIALWRRHGPARIAVLAAPALVLLGAAAAEAYPARGRLVLFLVPAALLLVAAAPAFPPERFRVAGMIVLGATLAVAAASPVAESAGYLVRPITKTEARHAFEAVKAGWREGDALYIHHGANAAYRYYGPPLGLALAGVLSGTTREPCDDRVELAKLLRTRRVWLVFGHQFAAAPRNERDIVASHVAVVATPLGVFTPPGAAAYLFDTTEPADPSGARVVRAANLTCVSLAA
jgi:hypothetical protein